MLKRWNLRDKGLLLGVVLFGLLTTNCLPPPQRYCIRRSALVPVPAPAMRAAKLSSGYIESSVGMDTVLSAFPPKRLEWRNVGLYIPRFQFSGNLMASIVPQFRMGFSWEAGLSDMAVPIAPGLIAPPNDPIGGGGLRVATSFKIHSKVTLDLGCDFWLYNITSNIQYQRCEGTGSGSSDSDWRRMRASTLIPMFRFQAAVGIDFNWSHLTIGFGARNQPHNTDSTTEILYSSNDITPALNTTVYPYAYVSWEVHISKVFHVAASVYQPLMFDPVIFAPILGVHFRLTSFNFKQRAREQRRPHQDPLEKYDPYDTWGTPDDI